MIEHAEHGANVFCLDGGRFQVHGDHDFRAHLLDDVGGQVVQQPAIHVNGISFANRRKRAGDGHGGAQRNR